MGSLVRKTPYQKWWRMEKHLRRVHHQRLSTWSTLASAFNTKPSRNLVLNHLMKEDVGLFGIPQLQNYAGFYILDEQAQNEVEALVEEAVSPDRQRKMVQVFDQLSDTLCRVADMADFVRASHPDKKYQQAADDACVNLSGLVEKLNTNTALHSSLREVVEMGDKVPTDNVDSRVAQLFLFDFEQSGIHLEETKRQNFVKLKKSILMLGHYFVQGTDKPCEIHKSKVPEHLRHCFSIDGDNIIVSGPLSDHFSEQVREAAYRIYLYPVSHQMELLDALLQARHQMAELVGFPTYGHRELRGTMLETPEVVMNFLETLAEEIRGLASEEYTEILQSKSKQGYSTECVKPWDPSYYTPIIRKERFHVDMREVVPYFSLGCCMEGLNNLFKNLFGVSLQPVEVGPGEIWSYDVHKLAVVHEEEGVLGYIYCDFFERADKPNQDCQFTIQGGRVKEDGTYQHPVVVLLLNLSSPQSSVPSLLTPGMVENLFHEFGHAMHSMLGRTKYQHVTGTRCATDFAEVPSILMEYFASDPRVIMSFARHYKTGEPLPREVVDKLCSARRSFAASDMQLQVFYSMLDQVYHGKYPCDKTTTELVEEVQNKYYGIPYIPGTAWQLRFGHLVGYGAKYYSYLLSRAVASRLWQKCFQDNPFNREQGHLYRNKMLAHGGGIHPSSLVQDMLGEAPSTEKLVKSLVEDLKRQS